MLARILQVGTVADGSIYLLVGYWHGDAGTGDPDMVNDFIIDLPESVVEHVHDPAGRRKRRSGAAVTPMVEVDGEWRPRPEDPADPWERRTVVRDLVADVRAAIVAYGRRHPAGTGDRRDPSTAPRPPTGKAAKLQRAVGAVIEF